MLNGMSAFCELALLKSCLAIS